MKEPPRIHDPSPRTPPVASPDRDDRADLHEPSYPPPPVHQSHYPLAPRDVLHLQRAAGNAAVRRWLAGTTHPHAVNRRPNVTSADNPRPSPATTLPAIQRTWKFAIDLTYLDTRNDTFYWDSPTGAPMPDLMPGAARRYKLARSNKATLNLHGRLEMDEAQYLVTRGGGKTGRSGKGEKYNPFGRFSTQLTSAAYIPHGTDPSQYANLGTTLAPGLGALVEEHAQIIGYDELIMLDRGLVPRRVQVTGGGWLNLVAFDPLGATYGDGPPLAGLARSQQTGRRSEVPRLKEVAAELARHGATGAVVAEVNKSIISAYSGTRSGEDQQLTIMGASAADMAAAAGYDGAVDPEFAGDLTPSGKKKHGWQWLHLIAYALGGPEGIGPQKAENLVVGTTAANTAMIMIEDAINNAIMDPTIPVESARIVAKPVMADPDYLIAETIMYQVVFTLTNGRKLPDITLGFDALSTATPYEASNKYFRTVLKQLLDQEAQQAPKDKDLDMAYV